MTIDPSKNVLENAYILWKASTQNNLASTAPDELKQLTKIHEITNTLFNTLISKKWYCRFSLFSRISKQLVLRDVKRALSALKFDLVTASTLNTNELWIFRDREKPLASDLRLIFKKHLIHRSGVESIRDKAKRWNSKAKKYRNNPRYLLASSTLTVIADRYPKIRIPINQFVKPMKPSTIKEYADWMLEGQDPAVEQGLTKLLGRTDFDSKAPFNTILKAAIYEIGSQKVKNVARETFEACAYYLNAAKDKVCTAVSGLKNLVFYPFKSQV